MSSGPNAATDGAQVEMQIAPVELQRPAGPRGLNRLLANRQLWKNAIYSVAFITYLCSFLFFGLAIADIRETGGVLAAVVDLMVAMDFVVQGVFLFVLTGVGGRRREDPPIHFSCPRAVET